MLVENIKFTISQSVCRCLSLHLLRIGTASFALDHSSCAKLTFLILLRCQSPYYRFPLLRRPSFDNIPFWVAWWVCVYNGSPRSFMLLSLRAQRKKTFMSGFPSTFGSLALYRETKFIIGFDFAVTLSSPASSCVLFDITSRLLMELKRLMLNKHKRWFHSSRVKFLLVRMSASWFLVRCTWFGFWGPNRFDRTTNLVQLCGSWKHVSLSDFFPL